ncbi:MAG: sugar transferase [Planctomycetota bacterium]
MHKNNGTATSADSGLLRFAVSSEPVADIVFNGLSKNLQPTGDTDVVVAVPQKWTVESCLTSPKIEHYGKCIPLSCENLYQAKQNSWFVISNGRVATKINNNLLYKTLTGISADVVAVNVEPQLLSYCEKVRLTDRSKVVGFRRLYSDFSQLAPFPADWPHHIFVKTGVLKQLLAERALTQSFSDFIKSCRAKVLTLRAISVGGTVLDLNTEKGLLSFLANELNSSQNKHPDAGNNAQKQIRDTVRISDSARLFGKILFGRNISIGQNATIVGPTVIGSNVKIAKSSVVRSSIIGPGVSISCRHLIQNRVFTALQCHQKQPKRIKASYIVGTNDTTTYKKSWANNFRTWPTLSYAGCFKRIADILVAITVLVLFAPVLPMIVFVIKLTSRGPVFFKDKRQGLHGKMFSCLKFRTMLVGADKIQDKLRVLNQADGPQFKMSDDPRISTVGKFLRDTYIDEIPQFFNVLFGQMSVVGPRPSPETENTLCPSWRDARLSVRPGVTGLWQICRTRQPMKDFQEWIHYDIKYVRKLSLKMDLWICWQTLKKMVKNFIKQF